MSSCNPLYYGGLERRHPTPLNPDIKMDTSDHPREQVDYVHQSFLLLIADYWWIMCTSLFYYTSRTIGGLCPPVLHNPHESCTSLFSYTSWTRPTNFTMAIQRVPQIQQIANTIIIISMILYYDYLYLLEAIMLPIFRRIKHIHGGSLQLYR